jgi:2-iminobutanoate/2-iminopropanoate deaminase
MTEKVRHFLLEGSRLPFSAGVQVGDLLFLSGQIGVDADGQLATGIRGQVDQAMANIREALTLAGADLSDIVKCTIMLRDMTRWDEFNAAYLAYFEADRLPARSAFGGVHLAFGAELEIECIAHLPAAKE